jgi:hypothetical protein
MRFDPRVRDAGRAVPDAVWRSRYFGYYSNWPTYGAADYVAAQDVYAAPPSAALPAGGLQLDVQPWSAEVYVDGEYAGHVGDFTGFYRPLALLAGEHVVVVALRDYEPLILPVVTAPGVTDTYRGTLSRAPGR